jgi:hypothetical protein
MHFCLKEFFKSILYLHYIGTYASLPAYEADIFGAKYLGLIHN